MYLQSSSDSLTNKWLKIQLVLKDDAGIENGILLKTLLYKYIKTFVLTV